MATSAIDALKASIFNTIRNVTADQLNAPAISITKTFISSHLIPQKDTKSKEKLFECVHKKNLNIFSSINLPPLPNILQILESIKEKYFHKNNKGKKDSEDFLKYLTITKDLTEAQVETLLVLYYNIKDYSATGNSQNIIDSLNKWEEYLERNNIRHNSALPSPPITEKDIIPLTDSEHLRINHYVAQSSVKDITTFLEYYRDNPTDFLYLINRCSFSITDLKETLLQNLSIKRLELLNKEFEDILKTKKITFFEFLYSKANKGDDFIREVVLPMFEQKFLNYYETSIKKEKTVFDFVSGKITDFDIRTVDIGIDIEKESSPEVLIEEVKKIIDNENTQSPHLEYVKKFVGKRLGKRVDKNNRELSRCNEELQALRERKLQKSSFWGASMYNQTDRLDPVVNSRTNDELRGNPLYRRKLIEQIFLEEEFRRSLEELETSKNSNSEHILFVRELTDLHLLIRVLNRLEDIALQEKAKKDSPIITKINVIKREIEEQKGRILFLIKTINDGSKEKFTKALKKEKKRAQEKLRDLEIDYNNKYNFPFIPPIFYGEKYKAKEAIEELRLEIESCDYRIKQFEAKDYISDLIPEAFNPEYNQYILPFLNPDQRVQEQTTKIHDAQVVNDEVDSRERQAITGRSGQQPAISQGEGIMPMNHAQSYNANDIGQLVLAIQAMTANLTAFLQAITGGRAQPSQKQIKDTSNGY